MLQSAPHISWTLEKGSTLEDRPRYNSEITFETFPFPWPPGHEPSESDDPRVSKPSPTPPVNSFAFATHGSTLQASTQPRLRTAPSQISTTSVPDRAVFAAYGWEYPLTRDQILGRLLKLNHERADSQISST